MSFKQFLKYSILFSLFTKLVCAGNLTGTVYDLNGLPINNVEIALVCQSCTPPNTFDDTSFTDINGNYIFEALPIGTYNISLRKSNYGSKDSLMVFSDENYVINYILDELPRGTYYSGVVAGTWEPSGNPHRIVDNIQIDSELYIAPGCTVLSENGVFIQVNRNLRIGSKNSSSVYLSEVEIIGSPPVGRAVFYASNCIFYNCKFDNQFGTISFDQVDLSGEESVPRFTGDTIEISETRFLFPQRMSMFSSRIVSINKSTFKYVANFSSLGGSCSFRSEYSNYFHILDLAWGDSAQIDHCNIKTFNFKSPFLYSKTTVSNSIIGSARLCPEVDVGTSKEFKCDTIFSSFFDNCIFETFPVSPTFGFLAYNQTNINNDSSDSWFNMNNDPMFVDSERLTINVNSPAIGAASDGTNIGIYQGEGVPIKREAHYFASKNKIFQNILIQENKYLILEFNRNQQPIHITIYNIRGKKILFRKYIYDNMFIINCSNWNNGIYFIKAEMKYDFDYKAVVLYK